VRYSSAATQYSSFEHFTVFEALALSVLTSYLGPPFLRLDVLLGLDYRLAGPKI